MNLNPQATDLLIVDDTPANLQLLSRMLRNQGYKVRTAPSGRLALMGARAASPDLILLDITMPEMSGYEVCEQLKADAALADIPVIFISALDQTEDKVRAFQIGGVDYITKPFQIEEVLARIHTHLTLRSLQRALQAANAQLEWANANLERRVIERTADLVRLNEAAHRFVPREILSHLGKQSITEIALGDQMQGEMTVLFADIVGFTALSESLTPQENFNYLNAFLGAITPVIRQHGGFIDKYLGDGVMAIFPRSPEDAIRAALAMQQAVGAFNAGQSLAGGPPLAIGIGLHTGKLMLGILGEDHRWQGTVISDAVNLAARIEALTRELNAPILVSEEVVAQVRNLPGCQFIFRERVQVKGKQAPVAVYEVRA